MSTQPMAWPGPRLEAAPRFSLILLSALVGLALPLGLGLYWLGYYWAPNVVGPFLRIFSLGCAAFLGFLWYRAPLTFWEAKLFRVLAIAGFLWLIAALFAPARGHAIAGWIKLLVLFAFCLMVARALRHPPTARWFGIGLLIGGVLIVGFIVFLYVKHMGFSFPSFKQAREFKGIAEGEGMSLNSVAFAAVFSYLAGLCLLPVKRIMVLFAVPVFAVSSMFTGSRAPIFMLGAAAFALLCINGLRAKRPIYRLAMALITMAAVVGLICAGMFIPDAELTKATEGRWHLWGVGLRKFSERPLYGYGYESWNQDLVSRLPGELDLTFKLASSQGGAYHNQYIVVLAEEGLLGGAALAVVLWLLFRMTWLLAFTRFATAHLGQWGLFACIFILLRSNFEVPGFFGYAQDPVDYLAYIFLAAMISRFSVEEDYARSLAAGQGRWG